MTNDDGNTLKDLEERRRWRQEQWTRRRVSSAWLIDHTIHQAGNTPKGFIRPPRPARCGWPIGMPAIRLYDGKAHVSGLEHCGNPWCCPLCSPVIRGKRARDLRATVEWWNTDPLHGLAFATLTIPHTTDDPLAAMTTLVADAWSLMTRSQRWRALRRAMGVRHYARALEITWSPANGWHPHLHLLLYLDGRADARRLKESLHDQWSDAVSGLTPERRKPSRRRGVLVESVDANPARVAAYMSKTPDRRDIASEMTRSDRKHGRHGSLAPFRLLDPDTGEAIGREKARNLWIEYTEATYRRRSITWSRHLRHDAGLATEKTDRQIIDDTLHGIEAISLTSEQYKRLAANPNILAHILEKTETGETPLALDLINTACTGEPGESGT